MKAITICQPYAHLIVGGSKRVENRTWPTRHRGRIYIHAGKSREWLTPFTDDLGNEWQHLDGNTILVKRLAFGAIVAIASLVDCIEKTKIDSGACDEAYPWLRAHPHTHGPWCWILADVTPIGPWPWRGAQGLFDIDEDELDRVANRELGIKEPSTSARRPGAL